LSNPGTPVRRRPGRRARATVLCSVMAIAGCMRGSGDARDLAVASDDRARAVVDAALADLGRGDVAATLGRFCDVTDAGRQRASELLAPALRRRDLVVWRVEPAWVGAEPFFFVEVGSRDGGWRHGLGVRVRDGCLDRAVGAGAPRPADDTVIDL